MYQVIKDYFDLRLAEFNAMNSDYLVETSITLNRDRLPLNQRQANYSIKLDNFNSSESQSESYLVSGEVELTFSMVNKKIIDYEAVQEYIYKLARYIRRKENYTSANKHFGITSIGGEDLNNLNEGSTELSAKLVFEGEYYETNAVTLTVPSAPTLTSPANGSTSGTLDQSFQWTGTADSWHIVIYLNSVEVISQEGLDVSSFTVPLDSLLTDATEYEWKVRGKNAGGYGDFSDLWSFTTDDSVVVSQTPLQVGLDDIWVRGDDITLSGAKVSSWNDKSGNARHLTNSTTGNRPITETISGKTFVKFEGTSANVRNLSYNDSAHLFKLSGTETRTFVFTIVTRQNTPGRYNSIFARSNNSVGDEYQLRLLSNGGSVPYWFFYTFLTGDQTTNGCLVLPENEGVLRQVILEVVATTAKLYIDGVLISTATLKFPAVTLPANAATFLVIGGTRQPNATQGTFAGAIGEFASGAVALTTGQVASLYKYHQEYYGV